MENIKKSPFSFNNFHVAEFSIKRNPNEVGTAGFDFEPKGFINEKDGTYMLEIAFSVTDSNDAYQITANCLAFFNFDKSVSSVDEISNFFYGNAPAIAFPYIRSFVASVTALSGLEAIHLPLLHFPAIIGTRLKENTETINVE